MKDFAYTLPNVLTFMSHFAYSVNQRQLSGIWVIFTLFSIDIKHVFFVFIHLYLFLKITAKVGDYVLVSFGNLK